MSPTKCLYCYKELEIKQKRDIGRKKFCSHFCKAKYYYDSVNPTQYITQESRRKQSATLIERYKKFGHPHENRVVSEEVRLRISEGQKRRYKERPESFVRGPWHPMYRGDKRRPVKGGYVYIVAVNHPRANMYGLVREHVIIAETKLGRFLTADEVVHHLNRIKIDNRPENLEVMEKSKHSSLHIKERWKNVSCGV